MEVGAAEAAGLLCSMRLCLMEASESGHGCVVYLTGGLAASWRLAWSVGWVAVMVGAAGAAGGAHVLHASQLVGVR